MSAKINFLLGIERTEEDNILGKIISDGKFDEQFIRLTERSQGLKPPVHLFREFSDKEVDAWHEKFSGKQK